ncbi:protein NATD1-like isoform X1 [Poecilia reticulata]|uniref:Protein NATD1 n=1 Tax=Poecilia reticulata TaxID=8081 RepID=A0A3P9NA34_POERE|nr:PREDICTED: protein NATD1-like isoform X1 [Poecilia reticulata]
MAFKITSRLSGLTHRVVSCRTASSSCSGRFKVQHDRQNRRFTVTTGSSGEGGSGCAVLHYRFTGQKEVDLMSTFVPETFRGRGVAAALAQVSCSLAPVREVSAPPLWLPVLQAAMDFLAEEKLKARVSCWYIKKYIDEQPEQQFKDFIIS